MNFFYDFLGIDETVKSPLKEKTKFQDQWLRFKNKQPKCLTFILIIFFVSCIIGAITWYFLTNYYSMNKQKCIGDGFQQTSCSIVHKNMSEGKPKQNCKGDGFEQICYNVTESDGGKTIKCIKFLFVEDVINDEYYNFQDAKNACIKLQSSLWEIADGKPEWDAVIQIANKLDKSSMCLNAQTTNSTCQGMILK